MFRYLASLTCLNLENNGIVTLTSAAAELREQLPCACSYTNMEDNSLSVSLDMFNNSFVSIEPWPFSNLNKLKILSLGHLPNLHIVEDNAFRGLVNLEILNLIGCNNLHTIDVNTLQGCLPLTHVNLSSNALTTLQQELLPYFRSQTLYFNNNTA